MKQLLLLGAFVLLLGCQNNLPKQPQMLPMEIRLFDSIQHIGGEWRSVDRLVINLKNDSIEVLGKNHTATWNEPYEYYLELDTEDLDFFKSLDSIWISSIYTHLHTILPKHLKRLNITLYYTYKDKSGTPQAVLKGIYYSEHGPYYYNDMDEHDM